MWLCGVCQQLLGVTEELYNETNNFFFPQIHKCSCRQEVMFVMMLFPT